MRRLAALVLLAGCNNTAASSADAPASDTDIPPYTQMLPDGPCGVDGISGTIAGVTLSIHSTSCVYKRGTPAQFTYTVTTTDAVPPIALPTESGCGLCGVFSSEPLTFTRYDISGSSAGDVSQRYCECDVGCCAPHNGQQIQVSATTQSFTIDWSGRTWDGPSDTDNPMGAFFLPGRYDVHVTFGGFDAGSVEATLPIEILP